MSNFALLNIKHEQDGSYKTRAAAECFRSDKARIASILNGIKNDPFDAHFISLFTRVLDAKVLRKSACVFHTIIKTPLRLSL